MVFLLQSLIFETMVGCNLRDAAALSDWCVNKHLEVFRDPQLTQNKTNPCKMMYDSIRILGLIIYVEMSRLLIMLSAAQKEDERNDLKVKLIRALICLCSNSRMLKQDDNHLRANINHLQYLISTF